MSARRRLGRGGAPIAGALALALLAGAGRAREPTAILGRPLVEVLESLESRGLNLIYSTAVVTDSMVVTVEPRASAPRAILEEILPPLGLEARDGPGGAVLIVPAERPAPGRIRGRVVSGARRGPIAGATVSIEGLRAGSTTRPDGAFEIPEVPPGVWEVTLAAEGFVPRSVAGVRVASGEATELRVTLTARPTHVEAIVVTPGRHAVVRQDPAAGLVVDDAEAVLVPTIGGDVTRVVGLLPGVSGPDNSAAVGIRGSEARDVSLILDGLELYEPFHLSSFQSPFSFIDGEIVESIEVLGGGFTADLGDRHGGFIELTTDVPSDRPRTRLEPGTLNSGVSFGAPLESGSLLVSARAWYPEALRNTIEFGEVGLDPRFGDAYVKFSRFLSPRTILSAHALLAYDRLDFRESDGNETVRASTESVYVWLRALRSWSPAVFSTTVVSAGRIDRARRGISEPEDEAILVADERTVDFRGLRHDMTWEASEAHLLRGGFEVRPLEAEYRYSVDRPAGGESLRLDPSGTSIGAYVAYRAALSDGLASEAGLRWDRQSYTRDARLSPRLNILWRPGERSELRLGLGRFHQSQRIHELRVEDGERTFGRAEMARQAEITYQHRLSDRLSVRFDAYWRKLSRLQPRYENLFDALELFPETESDRVLVAPDRARSRGVEVLLRGHSDGGFHGWLSYAWSSAEDVIDGVSVPRSRDQTHAGKFLAAYRFDRGWTLSLAGTIRSGWPTTPVSGEARTLPDGSVGVDPVIGARNSARFPTYARLDFKASREIRLARSRLRVDLDVVNVTGRKNACCVDDFLFDARPDGSVGVQREIDYWLGTAPSVSLLWEF